MPRCAVKAGGGQDRHGPIQVRGAFTERGADRTAPDRRIARLVVLELDEERPRRERPGPFGDVVANPDQVHVVEADP